MLNILLDHQQTHPQIFDYFRISCFISLARFIRVKTDLGDVRDIVQKFPAFLGQGAAQFHFAESQSVQQTMTPVAERINPLPQGRIVIR